MSLTDFLGLDVNELLQSPPFASWNVTRSVDAGPSSAEVWYEFPDHGLEVICDQRERIRSIFVHRGDAEALSPVPFRHGRQQVREAYGAPEQSGAAGWLPGIGSHGAWDRFRFEKHALHVQYSSGRDEVELVTLLLPGAVPGGPS